MRCNHITHGLGNNPRQGIDFGPKIAKPVFNAVEPVFDRTETVLDPIEPDRMVIDTGLDRSCCAGQPTNGLRVGAIGFFQANNPIFEIGKILVSDRYSSMPLAMHCNKPAPCDAGWQAGTEQTEGHFCFGLLLTNSTSRIASTASLTPIVVPGAGMP
jgi:hypothetical protein